MTRKRIRIGIVLIAFTLALGSNVWAGYGSHGKQRHYGKGHHQCHKAHRGHHYGWAKGKGQHKRCYRHHRPYRHRDHRPVVVEKHIYHEYRTAQTEPVVEESGGFRFAFSVADEAVGISLEVNETY